MIPLMRRSSVIDWRCMTRWILAPNFTPKPFIPLIISSHHSVTLICDEFQPTLMRFPPMTHRNLTTLSHLIDRSSEMLSCSYAPMTLCGTSGSYPVSRKRCRSCTACVPTWKTRCDMTPYKPLLIPLYFRYWSRNRKEWFASSPKPLVAFKSAIFMSQLACDFTDAWQTD